MNLLILTSLLLLTTTADIQRLTPAELHELVAGNKAVVVDVRGSVPYERGHLAGAVWMPLGLVQQRASELPQDKLVVTYCTCKAEETSLEAAKLLRNLGFERVAVLTGGYPAWVEAGLPTESNRASAPAAETPRGGAHGRLAPPAAVSCRRDDLTSFAGAVVSREAKDDRTVIVLKTSAGTRERVTVEHEGRQDASAAFLFEGSPFLPRHRERIEDGSGSLREHLSAVAWVCGDGRTWVDWRPGVEFRGAE